ncbi:Bone morphogenetic protein 1 [Oopsacas minuta]|uniref:Bone morphogenetic protein 1 n=1 Tax=Oopsacas minuta TaxID=111878 RepID=A0AAV7JLS3_9METZ|nr:Bone morphogenetic protein 1 [Oopsacas minuta]
MMIVGISVTTAATLTVEREVSRSHEQESVQKRETQGSGSNSSTNGLQGPIVYGYLIIYIKYAVGLSDTDGPGNLPDPYVVLNAYDRWGNLYIGQTSYVQGTVNPAWYEVFNFGTNYWSEVRIQVFDEDFFYWDDVMTPVGYLSLTPGYHYNYIFLTNGYGYVVFNYYLI